MGDSAKEAARKAMIAKRFGGNTIGATTGGGGNARRKKKATPKISAADDKKVANNLKRLNPQTIPGIEEVNIFKENNEVIHFVQPKVQAAVQSKTFIISGGNCETTTVEALMPGIVTQMGNVASQMGMGAGGTDVDDDDEPPELVDDDDEPPALVADTD